ncbi:MAG: NotI family restriction endonuclease [Candidatus Zixiibacteriota bacterium]
MGKENCCRAPRRVFQNSIFRTLPELTRARAEDAEIAWLIYNLKHDKRTNRYRLVKSESVYTLFQGALDTITTPAAGSLEDFMELLQDKLDEKLEGHPPDAPTLLDIVQD